MHGKSPLSEGAFLFYIGRVAERFNAFPKVVTIVTVGSNPTPPVLITAT